MIKSEILSYFNTYKIHKITGRENRLMNLCAPLFERKRKSKSVALWDVESNTLRFKSYFTDSALIITNVTNKRSA